jgi:alkanesulfonate monooxygenase SsuD/methylene tetrahydromethanopterin reductase-like flavin-dependent oxidoreductase (luciferase family)
MSVRVGISVVPASAELDRIRELVRAADDTGLDVVGIQDHPYQGRFLDTWSLIPSLLAQTSRVSLFTDVANLPLRPPAMMAKAAATLDVLSGGRFDLGLGAGAFPEIVARLGGVVRTRGESIEALEEAIDVLRLMWSDAPSVSYDGTYYQLADARPGPPPAHQIGIWLGAFKPRMLRLVGRKADGWLPSLGVLSREELREANALIDETAREAGRDPVQIRRIINFQGVIGDAPAPARDSLPVGYLAGEPLAGPLPFWEETLAGFVADGFDTLVFWPVDASREQVERLAEVRHVLTSDDAAVRAVVTRYFGADARRDHDAILALFSDDATVVDERQTWRGPDEIRAWRLGPASKYTYTTEIASIEQFDADHYRASGRIEGDFPGGSAQLNWDFTITGGFISRLAIAP